MIKVSYDNFHTAEEMAARIALEYAHIQNIRLVDFGPVPKKLTPTNTADSSPRAEASDGVCGPTQAHACMSACLLV